MQTEQTYLILALWAILLLLAIPYARHARHPSNPPLAAYLVFVGVFTLCAAVLFIVLLTVLSVMHRFDVLAHPLGAVVFLVLVFGPALLIARWQLRQPRSRLRGPPS
jgi:L-asparagine transporter-like permease